MPPVVPDDLRGLPGWTGWGLGPALAAYARSADLLGDDWPRPWPSTDPDDFFARHFVPAPAQAGHLTGYYEPELAASPVRTERFRIPLHAPPPDLPLDRPWLTRAEIGGGEELAGLEIAWLDDPLDAFLVHVQGSARLRFPDGRVLRVGHAAKNGHPYRSIGAELIRRGAVPEAGMSLAAIRAWCAANPAGIEPLLASNPSYIFFQPREVAPAEGPLGAMGVPVTADCSLAVDPDHIPLGTPVWVVPAIRGMDPALCVAQDVGSAIKGAGRADLFCGSGRGAGDRAGAINGPVTLWPLVPRGGE